MNQTSGWSTFGLVLMMVVVPLLLLGNGGDATAGKALFDKKCATCHGKEGEGKEAMAKMMKVEMKHLGSEEVQAKKDADLTKDITEGVGKMKPVKGLSDADVANVVAYLRTLKK
jgi:mono/diheme cytochrome c family protein